MMQTRLSFSALSASPNALIAACNLSILAWTRGGRVAFGTLDLPVLLLRRFQCPFAAVPFTFVPPLVSSWAGRGVGTSGFPLESAAVRFCPEAGGRVSVNPRG